MTSDHEPGEQADLAEIGRLQTLYARHFDARDADRYAALYTDDTVVTTPWGQVIHGRDKMRKAVLNTPPGRGWHRPGESQIRIDGNTAGAVSTYTAQDVNGDICKGRYVDTYLKTPEGWRISSRAVFIDERIPAAAGTS